MIRFFKLQNNQWVETATYNGYRISPERLQKLALKLGYTKIYSQATRRLTQNYYYAKDCAVSYSHNLAFSLYDIRNYFINAGAISGNIDAVYFSMQQSKFDALNNDELKQLYDLYRCEDCKQLHRCNNNVIVGRNHIFCNGCVTKHAQRCNICGHWYMKPTSYKVYNLVDNEHYIVCNKCNDNFESRLHTCADCGRQFLYDGEFIRNEWYCYDCADEHRPPELIADYHDGYMPIVKQYATNEDKKDDTFICGTEIETECTSDVEPNDVAFDIDNIMNRPQQLCKFEHDGSLTHGFEIITQPASLNWYNENRQLVQSLFNKLNDYNCSYKDYHGRDKCGLHIHVNRSFFKDYDYENRLCYLFQRLKEPIRVLSQRHCFDYCAFSLGNITWDNIYYEKRQSMQGHGSAINCANRNTIEFRIYRGTTDYNQYMSYIEFTHNLCKLVRDTTDIDKIEHTTFNDVVNYAQTLYLQNYCAQLGLLGGVQ